MMKGCGHTARLFLILIILFLLPTCGGEELRSSLVITSTKNYRLDGHIIKRQKTRGTMQCAHGCLTITTCGGYNYKENSLSGEGLCELVGSLETKEDSFKLVQSQGWVSGKMKSEGRQKRCL